MFARSTDSPPTRSHTLESPPTPKASVSTSHVNVASPVPEHETLIISDSEPECYSGPLPHPLELMTCDMDLTFSFCILLEELDNLQRRFDPSVSTTDLRMGLNGAREVLDWLEKMAVWIEEADLGQWSVAMKEYCAVWADWEAYTPVTRLVTGTRETKSGLA
ncbi:hypothetical protein ARMSODRAFT_1026952 [Armillaria solidipes]|uniref:Uncharacterized protein n=1 Tax=Armillaria solidipes TaxID=1076256 RepID=A0A2H3B647_9AGAR|nr:hypothetical protein ARMSODRAFT_1026952 [Armillaria solidipes]